MKVELTQEFVDTVEIPRGTSDAFYSDLVTSGLALIVRNRKFGLNKFFVLSRRPRNLYLGSVKNISLSRARKLAEARKAERMQGRNGRVTRQPKYLLSKTLVESGVQIKCATHPNIKGFSYRFFCVNGHHYSAYAFHRRYKMKLISVYIGRAVHISYEKATQCALLLAAAWDVGINSGDTIEQMKARVARARDGFFGHNIDNSAAWMDEAADAA